MEVQKARQIGFFAALSMVLGSVVGIGIFLKNLGIIRAQQAVAGVGIEGTFSFWSLIASWIIAAIITLCAALSFSEIASSRSSKAGLGGWAEQLGGKRFGRFVRINHCTYYYAIFGAVLPFLAVEGLYNAINIAVNGEGKSDLVHFGYVFLGGFIILVSLIALNYLSLRGSSYLQMTSLVLKLVPLILVMIIGLINANSSNILDKTPSELSSSPLSDLYSTNSKGDITNIPSTQWFNAAGMFTALPGVLFAFDSFANVGNLATEVKNSKRTVPLVMVLSIVIAAIVYILISVGAGLTGFGDAGSILKTLIPNTLSNAAEIRVTVDIIINVFITISAFGVCNAMTCSLLRSSESLIHSGLIMGWTFYAKLDKKHPNLGALTMSVIMTFSINIIVGIIGTATNNDAVSDSVTNFPTLFFFLIYGTLIVLAFIDRFTKKQCTRVFGFWVAAPLSVIGIAIVFCYFFFYQYIIYLSQNINAASSAGLFFNASTNAAGIINRSGAKVWFNYDDAILFWFLLVWFIIFPFINHFVISKTTGYKKIDDSMSLNGI